MFAGYRPATITDEREGRQAALKYHVLVCTHKSCEEQGAKQLVRLLRRRAKHSDVLDADDVMITKVDCLDECQRAPVVAVYPEGVWYGKVSEDDAIEIVTGHLERGGRANCKILRDLSRADASDNATDT